MNKELNSSIIKTTFDNVSSGYDNKSLRFFLEGAKQLAASLDLRRDEHVLDVATGTGNAALAIASYVPQGRVVGIDFSPGMLEQARRKAASLNVRNIEFMEADMRTLAFPNHAFDAAVCAFGIFFVEDMEAQLSHIADVVKPGGIIAISGFQENYFQPLRDLLVSRLTSYGIQMPAQTWKSIAAETGCRQLFERVGLKNIKVESKNIGYYLDDPEDWWDVIWNAGFRSLVSQLSAEDQEKLKGEHLQEIEVLRTEAGIWLDVGVLFTTGIKP